jgi:hypothetical protein
MRQLVIGAERYQIASVTKPRNSAAFVLALHPWEYSGFRRWRRQGA